MTSSRKTSNLRAYLQLHFIVWIWGFTAILGQLITIPPVEVVFYRTLFAALGLFALLKLKKIKIGFSFWHTDFWATFATGSLIAIHWILFFMAVHVANVSICLAGMATTSLWTSLIDPIINKRKLKMYEPILGLVSLIGIVVVFNASTGHFLGFALAVVSAMLSAVFTIINGRLVKKQNHFTITYYEMIGAFATTILFIPVYLSFFTSDGLQLGLNFSDTAYLLILGLVCTVYAYSIAVKLMHRLTAFVINLTVNLEPVYGIILAMMLFGADEQMGINFYLGTGIILLSVLLYPGARKYFNDPYMDSETIN